MFWSRLSFFSLQLRKGNSESQQRYDLWGVAEQAGDPHAFQLGHGHLLCVLELGAGLTFSGTQCSYLTKGIMFMNSGEDSGEG